MNDLTIPQVYAYAYSKLEAEGVKSLLTQNSSRTSKQALEACIAELNAVGLPNVAAILTEHLPRAPDEKEVRFCNWTLSYKSLEDMETCKMPNGKCNCLINKAYW